MRKRFIAAGVIFMALAPCGASAQQPVEAGGGSYASSPLLSHGKTPEHGGDESILMQTKKLWIAEQPDRPIPTNDWWTGLINTRYADALWSYPAMVRPSESGVAVNYANHWNDNGTEVKWNSSVEVRGLDFKAVDAIASDWHDWDVEMLMRSDDGRKSITTTLVHGTPMTWFELRNIEPELVMSAIPEFFGLTGNRIELAAHDKGALGVKIGDDLYGIYFPEECTLSESANSLYIECADGTPAYIVVALLTDESQLGAWREYALNKPVDTRVSWVYDERLGEITSTWTVTTRSLATGGSGGDIVQGFLPHAYKGAVSLPAFTPVSYLTPRGTMKTAVGTSFSFTHHFEGMLPWWGAPKADDTLANPYRSDVMEWLMREYAEKGTFGEDTYWGGKGLLQMAQNMTFALETGNTELFEISRDKLKTQLENWLTYTPGEERVYFTRYPRWGALVGMDTSYGSDAFNDHHFHYGYFTMAGAMLAMVDEDFRDSYGPMLRLIAKDYANWERDDTDYPFFRTFDPWVGHSYAGGLGDNGNHNGNGQESSSESMQSWGGIYLLGVALNDKKMRDAGIFGWATEARATREYWFDVDSRFDRHGQGGNFDHTLYKDPYNTNITCKGIGWWTWFSADPLHMHGIQWLPASPALDYLSWDPEFVKWAYDDMVNTDNWIHKWFEPTYHDFVWDGEEKSDLLDPLANNDWGNVTLTYMQRAMPDEAAAIFDEAWDKKTGIVTNISTGHISYYLIHSHRTYGEIDREAHADIPSANRYEKKDGADAYMVYNPGEERMVNFYRKGALLRSVKAPGRKFTVFTAEARPERIAIESSEGTVFPQGTSLSAKIFDQYGATADGAVTWSVSDPAVASVTADGLLTASAGVLGKKVTVTAECSEHSLKADIELTIDEKPYMAEGSITPAPAFVESGAEVNFTLNALDQRGNEMEEEPVWTVNGVKMDKPVFKAMRPGSVTVAAAIGGRSVEHTFTVTPPLPNLALGRTATSSSEENAGTKTEYATDGDHGTRWGSQHRDGEWIYVDLGHDCDLTRVVLDWETASAADYDIETAPDGASMQMHEGNYAGEIRNVKIVADGEWRNALSVRGNIGAGIREHRLSARGRYVRIHSLKRTTGYGTSLQEFEVHGLEAGMDTSAPLGVEVSFDGYSVDEGKSVQMRAEVFNLKGEPIEAPVEWSTSQGTVTPDGVFRPDTYGIATLTASTADGRVTGSCKVPVNEVYKAVSLRTDRAAVTMADGDRVYFALSAENQFGGEYDIDGAIDVRVEGACDNGITVDMSDGCIEGCIPGEYTVIFSLGKLTAEIYVKVVDIADMNLALNKSTKVSSVENDGLAGAYAVDGDYGTRWGSRFNDNEYISVDLGRTYIVDRIKVVTNDAAFAKTAHLEYSLDGKEWQHLDRRVMTQIGVDEFPVSGTRMRHIRYTGEERATGYGIGVAELEAYGRHDTTYVESVADDPDRLVDVVTVTGVTVRSGVRAAEAAAGLEKGVYIIGSRKLIVL